MVSIDQPKVTTSLPVVFLGRFFCLSLYGVLPVPAVEIQGEKYARLPESLQKHTLRFGEPT